MLGIMLLKMWHKRWMNLSLLLGCVLLIGMVVSFPLYQKAAYDRMLQDEFRNYISSEGTYPAIHNFRAVSMREKGGGTILKLEEFVDSLDELLGVTNRENIYYYTVQSSEIASDMNRQDASNLSLSMGGISDLENHAELLSGEMFSEKGTDAEGRIEVVIDQQCMVTQGLLVGESLTFKSLRDSEGNPISVVIKGVFNKAGDDPYYWQMQEHELENVLLMNFDVFREKFTGENAGRYTVTSNFYSLFNYEDIKSEQIDQILSQTTYLTEKSKYRSVLRPPVYVDLITEYNKKINRISATLLILQIPVLVMLAAFLLMISGQMYEMEKNEISVIKSRGSSRGQIFRLYLYQGLVLTAAGALIGIPLGAVFAKMLGAVSNFLDFDVSRSLEITYTKEAFVYALCAIGVTLMSLTIPAIKHSKVSIVNLKQSRVIKKKSWWQKFYIDILCLGVSLYGYYNFHRNMTQVSGTVLSGQSLDPLLYISSSLFIVGMGLLFIRLHPYIVKLIYTIGKKFWKPASYISFMESIKSGNKMQLIMLFLIMTVSLGMYHATVARTILDNAVSNVSYADGGDVIIFEKWPAVTDSSGVPTGDFVEPDFTKYNNLDAASAFTKVYYDEAGYISNGKNDRQIVKIMGIHTKEFGQMTSMMDSLNEKPYYEYLNELAVESSGALVSRNFNTLLGYEIGDSVYVKNSYGKDVAVKIVDFVDYFPTYAPTVTDIGPDGNPITQDRYLLVTHYELTKGKFGLMPYEVWVKAKEEANTSDIYDWIEENDVRIKKYINRNDDLKDTMEDPLLQGTNGVLTMSFIVTILLCAVGYLIYWIMSIKERELIFGVLRASGFHKREIIHLILNEQIFSGILPVIAGIGIGSLSSVMFVPIIQLSYASSTQILPMRLIVDTNDLIRLYGVIGAVMLVSIVVLIALLFHMNVTKALKLGEE